MYLKHKEITIRDNRSRPRAGDESVQQEAVQDCESDIITLADGHYDR